jgi:hypothetical protein
MEASFLMGEILMGVGSGSVNNDQQVEIVRVSSLLLSPPLSSSSLSCRWILRALLNFILKPLREDTSWQPIGSLPRYSCLSSLTLSG